MTSIRRPLAALLLTILALVTPLSATRAQAASCTGVWVVVESEVRCATSHSTGLDALRAAGFEVQTSGEFVCRIGGRPDTCTTSVPYWSYWHAERGADGAWGAWQYATVGPAVSHPATGTAEGWSYGDGNPPAGVPPLGSETGSATAPATSASAPAPTASATAQPAADPGTPTAALVTGGVVLLAGAGLAVWVVRARRP